MLVHPEKEVVVVAKLIVILPNVVEEVTGHVGEEIDVLLSYLVWIGL
jgi:hypothetical protein